LTQLQKRHDELNAQNNSLQHMIDLERKRQRAYETGKYLRDNLIQAIPKKEAEQVRLLELQAELSRKSELMEAEVLQARKAAGAKQEKEHDMLEE
jgi:hypothetical protein